MDFEGYLDYIGEAVVVVDNSLDVVSFNAAFKTLFPAVKRAAYVMRCLEACPELAQIVLGAAPGVPPLSIGSGKYAVGVSEIPDARDGAVIARAFVLSDVTELESSLEALEDSNRRLRESNEAVERKNKELEKQIRLKEKIAAGAEVGAILRDLHDTLGHSLTMLNALNRLALIEKEADESAGRAELEETLRFARISLTELDTMDVLAISGGERTMDITTFLYRLKQTMLGVSLEVRLSVSGEESPRHTALFIPVTRIIREAATNCLRHAGATEFFLSVSFQPDSIRIAIEDNGTSLSGGGELQKGNGLIGIEQRVRENGGEIEIGVTGGGGVFVRTSLPAGSGRKR